MRIARPAPVSKARGVAHDLAKCRPNRSLQEKEKEKRGNDSQDNRQPDPRFEVAIRYVFALALATTGILFAGLGLLSFGDWSGVLSVGAGAVCLALAAVVYFRTRRLGPVAGPGRNE